MFFVKFRSFLGLRVLRSALHSSAKQTIYKPIVNDYACNSRTDTDGQRRREHRIIRSLRSFPHALSSPH